jgi:AcrR family transcriptional regulator
MSKGNETRDRIVDLAVRLASRDGLAGLSIGRLASDLGMSKSGLFAHFGSKEDLQLEVLRAATDGFANEVVRPALKAPRGEPRLRALVHRWWSWAADSGLPGGCPILAASAELDDHPGPLRDFLASKQKEWLATLTRAVRLCTEVGHFRGDIDCEQEAFEILGIGLAYHHARRLLEDPLAQARARLALERLIVHARGPR